MHDPQRDGEFVVKACGRINRHGEVTQFDLCGTRLDLVARFWLATITLAAVLKSLLQPSVPRQFNKPEHGGGAQIKVIARRADGSG